MSPTYSSPVPSTASSTASDSASFLSAFNNFNNDMQPQQPNNNNNINPFNNLNDTRPSLPNDFIYPQIGNQWPNFNPFNNQVLAPSPQPPAAYSEPFRNPSFQDIQHHFAFNPNANIPAPLMPPMMSFQEWPQLSFRPAPSSPPFQSPSLPTEKSISANRYSDMLDMQYNPSFGAAAIQPPPTPPQPAQPPAVQITLNFPRQQTPVSFPPSGEFDPNPSQPTTTFNHVAISQTFSPFHSPPNQPMLSTNNSNPAAFPPPPMLPESLYFPPTVAPHLLPNFQPVSSSSSLNSIYTKAPKGLGKGAHRRAKPRPARGALAYESTIVCGIIDADVPVDAPDSKVRANKDVEVHSDFFGKTLRVFQAVKDEHREVLYQSSDLVKLLGVRHSYLAMHLKRRKITHSGIWQASNVLFKRQSDKGIKSGSYFLTEHACREFKEFFESRGWKDDMSSPGSAHNNNQGPQ